MAPIRIDDLCQPVACRVCEILKALAPILIALVLIFNKQIRQTIHAAGEGFVTFACQSALQVEPHRRSEQQPPEKENASEP